MNSPSSNPSLTTKSPSGCRMFICSWKLRKRSMPFCENDMRSMYTATHVTALYSASVSASFRRRACFSNSPSRLTNLDGSGKGSGSNMSEKAKSDGGQVDALWGTAFTYSYISSAQWVSTSVFCANCSNSSSNWSSKGSLSPADSSAIRGGLRGDAGALVRPPRSRAGDGLAVVLDVPNSFFVASDSARLSALAAAREALLEGDEERGGGFVTLGGGGKVILLVAAAGEVGKSGLSSSALGVDGIFRSWRGFRGRELISAEG